MSFVERHSEIIKKVEPQSEFSLWIKTAVFSLFLFVFSSFYLYARRGVYNFDIANSVVATVAVYLIGFSFALSGLCYFFNIVDTKIIYRKFLGLCGFAYALAHGIISLFLLPAEFPFAQYYLSSEHFPPFLFALIALFIFAMMAAISNRYAIHKLGGVRWRALLRLGYLGLVFVTLHFGLIKYKIWLNWTKSLAKNPLPPLSLISFCFIIAVFLIRLALFISENRAKKTSAQNFTPLSQ